MESIVRPVPLGEPISTEAVTVEQRGGKSSDLQRCSQTMTVNNSHSNYMRTDTDLLDPLLTICKIHIPNPRSCRTSNIQQSTTEDLRPKTQKNASARHNTLTKGLQESLTCRVSGVGCPCTDSPFSTSYACDRRLRQGYPNLHLSWVFDLQRKKAVDGERCGRFLDLMVILKRVRYCQKLCS